MSATREDAAGAPALVLGCNGQDGTFLTRHLLRRGHDVVGLGHEPVSHHGEQAHFRYARVDLRDQAALAPLLEEVRPARIFHFAAVHTHAGGPSFEQMFGDMLDVNVKSVHTCLEHMRGRSDGPRLIYAASVKCFGTPLPATIDEATPKKNACLYSISKNTTAALIGSYRDSHGVLAGSVYLFNHESELRPPPFFMPKLVRALAGERVTFFTTRFFCDWGSADEYSDIMIDIVDRAPGEDFVLATGRCLDVRELCERLFTERGMNIADHVVEQDTAPSGTPYQVDLAKLRRLVERVPEVRIEHVVARMLEARMLAPPDPARTTDPSR